MERNHYRKVENSIIVWSNDENMPPGITALRILLWMVTKTVNVLYIPLFFTRLFQRPKLCPPIQNQILLLSATELADRIRKQELTSESVIRAYIARIKEVNPIINAVIEDRFEEAIEDAKVVDQFISNRIIPIEDIKHKQPLLGVPLTVKGSIEVCNMKSTSGVVARANIIAKEDAVAVKLAREAGAIPILTSNIPELCLNWESTNKLVGTTRNPHDTTRTVGGSSGGEASLLATAGSVIGIGSDIAGSLRLPAHFCGVWGHKPTPGAVSFEGHYPSCKHKEVWRAAFTLGPMARYAPDLKLLLEVIAEPEVKPRLKLQEPVNLQDLKVYFMEDIESTLTCKVNADCLEALRIVTQHFNRICYTNCEKVKLPLMKYAPEMCSLALLDIDDVDNLFPGRGEGAYSELFRYLTLRSKSVFTSIAYGLVRRLTGYLPRSTTDNAKKKLCELKIEFLKLLGTNGVFLLPTFPAEAHHHGEIFRKLFDSGYLSVFNSLGLPVTNCPVKFTKGRLPVGIQVVGAPYCDRITLAVANEIEKAFGGWQPPKPIGKIDL